MNTTQSGFDFLRVSLEAKLSGPALITVTSALAEDDASMVASGLAESFAEAGHATALVSTRSTGALARRRWTPAVVPPGGRASLTRVSADQLAADSHGGRATLAGIVAKLRESYAITIVDAEPLPVSTVAYELVREADGVLVAIRLGRKPVPEDRTTLKLLEDCHAKVLGMVPTTARKNVPASASAPSLGSVSEADSFAQKRKAEVGS
jgi:Mrp family chromosome partitioning ATPase